MKDERLQLSHEDQLLRAVRVLNETSTATEEGCHGLSPFVQLLDYVHYNNLCLVPIAHALLYGVVASFVDYALRQIAKPTAANPTPYPPDVVTHAQRKCMRNMPKHMSVPSEYGRAYKCVVEHRGSYKMEEWQHFVETQSQVVFGPGMLPPLLAELWDLLVEVVQHYMRGSLKADEDDSPEHIENIRQKLEEERLEAAAKLHLYAETMEQSSFPARMFTYNLHLLVCRLPRQELARGPSGKDLEYCVERLMQFFKTLTGRRRSKDPEKVFANRYLMMTGLTCMQREQQGLQSIVDNVLDPPQREEMGLHLDTPLDDCILQNSGKHLRTGERDEVMKALRKYINVSKPVGWIRADAFTCVMRSRCVLKYTEAEVNESQLVGRGHGRAKTRPNYWVLVEYTDDNGNIVEYVATVYYFVKVTHPRQPGVYIRLAMVDLYDRMARSGRAHRANVGQAKWKRYFVPITQIKGKLCCYYLSGYERGVMYFMEYENMSKT